MEEEWVKFLRENHPELYKQMRRSVHWQAEWRDKEIDQLRTRNAELEAMVVQLEAERRRGALDGQAALDEANNEVARLRKALKHFADKAFLADTEGDLKTMSNFQSGGLFIADHVAKIAKAALEARDA